jgi:hypothetical protein
MRDSLTFLEHGRLKSYPKIKEVGDSTTSIDIFHGKPCYSNLSVFVKIISGGHKVPSAEDEMRECR